MDSLSHRYGAVPAFAMLDMPVQDLRRYAKQKRSRPSIKTRLARLVTFGGAIALTVFAYREMVAVVSVGGMSMTLLQGLMVGLFTITFAWIALAASSSVAGLLFGGVRRKGTPDSLSETRTALVMPICNEEPGRSFASLEAMAGMLIDHGSAESFEIFVLSDTTKADVWVKETAAFQSLRDSLGDRIRIWYRRRTENTGRKAGNVHDFVTRWGARYDFMIVLDADSILAPETLLTMAREMAADPQLGILQTVPRLCGGETLYARLQQFAGTVYGPIVARGITAWQGDDGNYWGHNAIIRTRAFAAAAGLPTLPGRKPFGGVILSHDFVEAALVRRAGWSVRMLPTLGGSWEESPPSLLDVASRDRRWAQGNMQHLAVVRSPGLAWPNRVHMWIGVMGYLSSPLWLALIVVGLAVTAQVASVQFEYFTDELTLFPRWPVFDSERMIKLFIIAMSILMVPKVLGLLRALLTRELRQSVGVIRLILSVPVETALSALYAPISMMIQSRQIWEIFRGQDSGWGVQSRQRAALPWGLLFRRHWLHMVIGIAVSVGLYYVSFGLLMWMAPTLLGLALAIPLSAASASVLCAKITRFCGFLTIPEELEMPRVLKRRDECELRLASEVEAATLERLLTEDHARHLHFASVLPRAQARARPDAAVLTTRAKLADARTLAEALDWLTPAERLAALAEYELFQELVRLRSTDKETPSAPVLRSA